MSFELPDMGGWINTRLAGAPLNWAIVFVVATIWLLVFHLVMQAFGAMQSTRQGAVGAAPGQVASPTTAVSVFSVPGVLGSGSSVIPGLFEGGAPQIWTDDAEARFASDGWSANP
jgi:hypothetical protein